LTLECILVDPAGASQHSVWRGTAVVQFHGSQHVQDGTAALRSCCALHLAPFGGQVHATMKRVHTMQNLAAT
jgi:hypothetical protein